ncbi:hypothetical protein EI555_011179, partial [Monodon monoceros]
VLPIIVFFICAMSVLYYVSLMQWVILKISWLMQATMGPMATKTLSTEAPLLIRPYLADMTLSEIHVVMTRGYATIAGSLLDAYISFGIDAASLIAASVKAAPCALALYTEVEESKFRGEEGVKLTYRDAQNLLEAASSGAAMSVRVVTNIAANLIAFLAVLDFINAALSWLGDVMDVQGLSFQVQFRPPTQPVEVVVLVGGSQANPSPSHSSCLMPRLICSYILWSVAFLMGVAWEGCPVVAELLGMKLFLNDGRRGVGRFQEAVDLCQSRNMTFALCGFANFSTIGIMLGGLTSMAPQQKSNFSQIMLWVLCTGACVSLVNACVAGAGILLWFSPCQAASPGDPFLYVQRLPMAFLRSTSHTGVLWNTVPQ